MFLFFSCRSNSGSRFEVSVKISLALVCQTLVVLSYFTSCNCVPAINTSAISGDPIQNPGNVVLVAGNEKMFTCAGGLPFRWYRYRISNPNLDEVIFMGLQMADNVDERFRIYTSPQNYPYKQLDLNIADVEASLGGTYRCFRGQDSHCAELIVLDSEPKCRIDREGSDNKDTVQLKCSVNVTANGQPEMQCKHNSQNSVTDTSLCERSNGIVTCMVQVPAEMQAEYTCSVRINAIPVTKYRTCSHADNKPSYTYTWESSSVVILEASSNPFNSPIVFFGAVATMSGIIFALIVALLFAHFRHRRQCRIGEQKCSHRERPSSTSSAESASSGCSTSSTDQLIKESENTEERPPAYATLQFLTVTCITDI